MARHLPALIRLLLLLALAAAATPVFVTPRQCKSSSSANPCTVFAPRDLLFVIDASESMDPATFFGPHLNPAWPATGPQYVPSTLDIVEELFCRLYNNQSDQTYGVVLFNHDVTVAIPLASYTPDEFFARVEAIRATKTSAFPACCTCCTPLAEAFDVSADEFVMNGKANGKGGLQIAYTITDGKPYQNTVGPYAWPSVDEATYIFSVVPTRALALKNSGVKILLVAVPSRVGNPGGTLPNIDYFLGIPDPALVPNGDPRIVSSCNVANDPSCQCVYIAHRAPGKIPCAPMRRPPFPIASLGLIFNSTWENIVNDTAASTCTIIIQDQTHAPSTRPTPSSAPVTTSAPAPTMTVSPTTTIAPSTTHKPTSGPPTPKPTPIVDPVDQLDLYVLLDSSRSMRWHASVCSQIPGGSSSISAQRLCWGVFVDFVRRLVFEAAALRTSSGRPLGWLADQALPTAGLRVTIYGFACANNQNTAVTRTIGVNIESEAAFNASLSYAENFIVPNGGTCPHQAIDDVVSDIATYDTLQRQLRSVIIITDGVWYDTPQSQLAARGLRYYCAQTLALALPGGEHGTSLTIVPAQEQELIGFVGGSAFSTDVFNFGTQGFNLLSDIATMMVAQLPAKLNQRGSTLSTCLATVKKQPVWCGYATPTACNNFFTGDCKWNSHRNKCTYLGKIGHGRV